MRRPLRSAQRLRCHGAKAEIHERLTEASCVFWSPIDEDVQILGQPRLAVSCDGVAANHQKSYAARDQQTQELCPVAIELDLHRTRLSAAVRRRRFAPRTTLRPRHAGRVRRLPGSYSPRGEHARSWLLVWPRRRCEPSPSRATIGGSRLGGPLPRRRHAHRTRGHRPDHCGHVRPRQLRRPRRSPRATRPAPARRPRASRPSPCAVRLHGR